MAKAEPETIYDLAIEICERLGTGKVGIKKLSEEILKHPKLGRESADASAEHYAGLLQRRINSEIWRSNAAEPIHYSEEDQERVIRRFRGLFTYHMMDGTNLAKADKEHLMSDSERHMCNVRGGYEKAVFLKMVAAKLKDDQLVEDVYSEAQLQKLSIKAREEAAKKSPE